MSCFKFFSQAKAQLPPHYNLFLQDRFRYEGRTRNQPKF